MESKHLKIIFFTIFCILFFSSFVLYKDGKWVPFSNSKETKIIREGDTVPSLQFDGFNSEVLRLSKKVTLIHFWATWCGPCAEELPSFDKLLSQFSDQIQVFAISQDDSEIEVYAFMKPLKTLTASPNFKIIPDFHHQLGSQFKVLALPETYIVNHEGKVLRKVVGAMDWGTLEVQKYFNELLAQ